LAVISVKGEHPAIKRETREFSRFWGLGLSLAMKSPWSQQTSHKLIPGLDNKKLIWHDGLNAAARFG
jgi:hypothetical protein